MGYGLGGEVAWLKILTVGRTKGVYPAPRRTIWEQSRGRLGAKSFRFLENTQKVERIDMFLIV